MTLIREWHRDGYTITTDPARLDLDVIHGFLSRSYWAQEIPREVVARAVANSLSFGLFEGDRQVGFARLITDYATFAYLADVFILEPYRGRGLSKWLMQVIHSMPELQGLRRWLLATHDAHGLYRQVGYEPLQKVENYMTRHRPDIYRQAKKDAP